jgi:D-glycero-D-manno-heptose 1,7-bisphosphate phosphatase
MGIRPLNNKAVFLDRDGVINRALVRDGHPYPPSSLDTLEIQPDVTKALNLLEDSEFLLIVVTNQPDVGRGTQKRETVEKMHTYLLNQLPLDDIYVCWHGQDGECDCRKPLPGMLFQAAQDWQINIEKSFMIGDRWRDVDIGYAAGCKTIFIDYQYDESLNYQPDYTATSIRDASEWIIRQSNLSICLTPLSETN